MDKNISEATYMQLIRLLQASFACNEAADDCAYDLDNAFLTNAGKIYHESFAHKFPELADEISDLIIKLGARPYRKREFAYNSIPDLFRANLDFVKKYQETINEAINTADLNGDAEAKIALEEFLLNFLPYVKQSEMWLNKAEAYRNNEVQFDVHFDDITPYIPIQED